jgi:hypothetical protein
MKFFIDTEFVDNGVTIDLISIGIVAEDNREFYRINLECDFSKASDWVVENVLFPISINQSGVITGESLEWAVTREEIKQGVLEFIGDDLKPQFWSHYCSYDFVVFCQLFGTMMDLPPSFPMYCNDIRQLYDRLSDDGTLKLPLQTECLHNALEDAKWNKLVYEFLQDYENSLKLSVQSIVNGTKVEEEVKEFLQDINKQDINRAVFDTRTQTLYYY